MLRLCLFAVFSGFVIDGLGADETTNEVSVFAKTEAVALFKNGYAVFRQEIDVPESGVYRWDDVPTAIHGTFFIESDMDVEVRTTQRFVSVWRSSIGEMKRLRSTSVVFFLARRKKSNRCRPKRHIR